MVCGRLEIDILNALWSLTEANEDNDVSIQDVVDYLNSKGTERAYTTIKTVMDRLTAKSVLVRYKSGKKFYYKATMSKSEMTMEAVKTLSDNFFDGNFAEIIRFIERNTQVFYESK